MRHLCLLIALLMTGPALDQYWQPYANSAFGYAIDIPPGYENQADSADGNGAIFMLAGRMQELTVWAAATGSGPEAFSSTSAARLAEDQAASWDVSYQVLTPDWATWSARRGDFILYQRMILLCDRQSYAAFRSVYPARDLDSMRAIIEGVVRSFEATGC